MSVVRSTAPTVSVVMPVYNGAAFLASAIESVLAQTYQDFELVIVDDQSSDGSSRVVAGFSDPRIRFVQNPHNLGMTGNWNRAISLARGRFVTMLHQDDEMLPENLARKVQVLEQGRFRWVSSDCFQIDANGQLMFEHWFRHKKAMRVASRRRRCQFAAMFFGANYLCFTTIMWERSLMADSGAFTNQGRYCADVHMWLKMLHRARLCYLDERLIRYRWAQNLSLNYSKDEWYLADFLARKAAASDLGLGAAYSLPLRGLYGSGFLVRLVKQWGRGEQAATERMRQGLSEVVSWAL